ncbi:MAG: 3-methyl-2-oxobutanoate hydroxymethyltransferase [Verrucomicrobia bacterium]|nr:3-methyl-2-oxobutanoate hydroxymethyltransferase [Verrucomicrobiota bacterium]
MTIDSLQARKRRGPKIVRINCYDYLSARIVDQAGVDMILVGESVGRFVLGYPAMEMVTLDDILHHVRAVRRGTLRALLMADLPLTIQQMTPGDALRMAQRLMDEGTDAVKVEGGDEVLNHITTLVAAGIPVHGTLRFDPSAPNAAAQASQLYHTAREQQNAGCFMLSLFRFPANFAAMLTKQLTIPTIGIGSGPACDGQVIVIHDLLGYVEGPPRPYVKAYANFHTQAEEALRKFKADVESGAFPEPAHWYEIDSTAFSETIEG